MSAEYDATEIAATDDLPRGVSYWDGHRQNWFEVYEGQQWGWPSDQVLASLSQHDRMLIESLDIWNYLKLRRRWR